jgi:hypothetical protein
MSDGEFKVVGIDSYPFGAGTDVSVGDDTIDIGVTPPTQGTRVHLYDCGHTLPTPFAENTDYYIRAISGTTFKLATTNSDETIVNITGVGSGTVNMKPCGITNEHTLFKVEAPDGEIVNYVTVTPNTTGGHVIIQADGEDNVDLVLKGNGSGRVRMGTYAAITTETLQGYITIKDISGNAIKLAVVA